MPFVRFASMSFVSDSMSLVRAGRVTPKELCTQAAEAVARVDPQIEAVLGLYEDVLADPDKDGPSREGRLYGVPMRVSAADTLINSLLCTGFPYSMHTDAQLLLDVFGDFIRAARAVRRLGSAAIDLAYVAAGRFDGFWEMRLNPWDISAGALLIEEAGGTVTTVSGAPFDSRLGEVLASNGRIHAQMLDVIRSASARPRFAGPP